MLPDTNTPASPAAVGLIADPFANQIAMAANLGTFIMSDGPMSTLELFASSAQDQDGIGVVILNCLGSPLKALEMYWDDSDDGGGAGIGTGPSQASYPAIVDSTGASNAHQIPAACSYPGKVNQVAGPPMMAGLGVYRFNCGSRPLRDNDFGGAISFSYKEGDAAPFLGVAFYWAGSLYQQSHPAVKYAVTTNLQQYTGYGSHLESFYCTTYNLGYNIYKENFRGANFDPVGDYYDGTHPDDTTTIAAKFMNPFQPAANERTRAVLNVFVFDYGTQIAVQAADSLTDGFLC